jgi:sulfite exporter TauE/SafE
MGMAAPLGLGVAWALLPCGLLYSALMVAALAGSVPGGAMVMAVFAIGSGVSLWVGPWLLLRLGRNGRGAWSMRVAGLALVLVSAWGLYMGLVHDQAPWCVAP